VCGIYASFNRQFSDDTIRQKLATIAHRGPDASRFVRYANGLVLAHNRLSIIDLNERAYQPFTYKNNYIHIIFNGEIYNFQELKKQLFTEGYAFSTSSDTEVICAAYLAYGEQCVTHFNGMFAFVLYDEKQQILFGARDRLGKKPFFYCLDNQGFECASALKTMTLGNKTKALDERAVSQFLLRGYVSEPSSIFKHIKKLKAAHTFTYDLATHHFSTRQYWEINEKPPFEGNFEEAKTVLHSLLRDSVEKRLITDVPLGAFLSGGIDSSLVASIAQDLTQNLKTFSIKFDAKDYDESPYARAVAKHLGTNHVEIPCNYADGIALIEQMPLFFQEPFGDSSAIPSMLLAKHTRRHVTVALTGDGGDESFLGYERYERIKRRVPLMQIPLVLRRLMASIIEFSPNYRHKTMAKGIRYATIEALYEAQAGMIDTAHLLDSSLADTSEYRDFLYSNKNLLERVSDYDLKTYLNGDINTKVDNATMAFSLEARAPLMDYRVVEFARSLPTDFKYKNGVTKRILKEILYEYAPKTLFDRPKSGFAVPLKHWFRNELKTYVFDTLTKKNLSAIPNLNAEIVQKQINRHMNNAADQAPLIWHLIVLVNWLKAQDDNYQTMPPQYV
jgi:asparagine synthase (glutamine-hydrolysing)